MVNQQTTAIHDEVALWNAFREGDKEAFASIYQLYARPLLSYGYKVTSDNTLVEDSIQDLFIELWHSRANLSATDSVKFYLFRALRNKILRNKAKVEIEILNDFSVESSHLFEVSNETLMIDEEVYQLQISQLQTSLQKLPKRQQEAINLRYYHDFSNEEVAQIMGVNYQSACKFIYTGLRFLKEHIIIPTFFYLLIS